jgi:dipeptidyl aminopeptidase/acylaminoacyl peptidase
MVKADSLPAHPDARPAPRNSTIVNDDLKRPVLPVSRLDTFQSQQHPVRLESSRLKGRSALAPAIFFLPGAAGLMAGDRRADLFRRSVCAAGFTAFIVHYFDRTHTRYATYHEIIKSADGWVTAVADAITFAEGALGIDPEKIAVVGHSLGGFLAMAHAATDPRVRAAVVMSGGIDPFTKRKVKRLPATLVIHGEEDQRVPIAQARELEAVLRATGAPVKTMILPGEGHRFSLQATTEALRGAIEFCTDQFAGA